MSYPTDPFILALDIGNSTTKYVSPWHRGYFPSVYALEEPGLDFEGLASARDFVISYEGQRYAIGHSAPRLGSISVRTLDRSRVLSTDYKILVAAALAAASDYQGTFAPVLNLPVEWYQRRAEVKKFLAGDFEVGYRGEIWEFEIPVESIRVVPEGFGTLCLEMLDDTGRATAGGAAKKTVGIIDVGMKTTDLTFFDDLTIVPVKTHGYETGLSQALLRMQRLAERDLNHLFSLEQLDAGLKGGHLFVGGEDVTERIDDWKHASMQQLANAVIGHVRSMWQGGQDAQELRLTGGAGQYLLPYLMEVFPHLIPVRDPAMANVDGSFRYGLMKARQQDATQA